MSTNQHIRKVERQSKTVAKLLSDKARLTLKRGTTIAKRAKLNRDLLGKLSDSARRSKMREQERHNRELAKLESEFDKVDSKLARAKKDLADAENDLQRAHEREAEKVRQAEERERRRR